MCNFIGLLPHEIAYLKEQQSFTCIEGYEETHCKCKIIQHFV